MKIDTTGTIPQLSQSSAFRADAAWSHSPVDDVSGRNTTKLGGVPSAVGEVSSSFARLMSANHSELVANQSGLSTDQPPAESTPIKPTRQKDDESRHRRAKQPDHSPANTPVSDSNVALHGHRPELKATRPLPPKSGEVTNGSVEISSAEKSSAGKSAAVEMSTPSAALNAAPSAAPNAALSAAERPALVSAGPESPLPLNPTALSRTAPNATPSAVVVSDAPGTSNPSAKTSAFVAEQALQAIAEANPSAASAYSGLSILSDVMPPSDAKTKGNSEPRYAAAGSVDNEIDSDVTPQKSAGQSLVNPAVRIASNLEPQSRPRTTEATTIPADFRQLQVDWIGSTAPVTRMSGELFDAFSSMQHGAGTSDAGLIAATDGSSLPTDTLPKDLRGTETGSSFESWGSEAPMIARMAAEQFASAPIPVHSVAHRLEEMVMQRLEKPGPTDPVSVVLRLNPPELGRVHVQVSLINDIVSIRMVATDEMSRQILDRQLSDLHQSLAGHGISFGQCQVDVNTTGHQSSGGGMKHRLTHDFEPTQRSNRKPAIVAPHANNRSTGLAQLDYVA
jgi:flagellar hook-length control protein FliK